MLERNFENFSEIAIENEYLEDIKDADIDEKRQLYTLNLTDEGKWVLYMFAPNYSVEKQVVIDVSNIIGKMFVLQGKMFAQTANGLVSVDLENSKVTEINIDSLISVSSDKEYLYVLSADIVSLTKTISVHAIDPQNAHVFQTSEMELDSGSAELSQVFDYNPYNSRFYFVVNNAIFTFEKEGVFSDTHISLYDYESGFVHVDTSEILYQYMFFEGETDFLLALDTADNEKVV